MMGKRLWQRLYASHPANHPDESGRGVQIAGSKPLEYACIPEREDPQRSDEKACEHDGKAT